MANASRSASCGAGAFVLAAVLLSLSLPARAEYDGDAITIPMTESQDAGGEEIELEATLYLPYGDGPFPVVIFSHGSTGPGVVPRDRTIRPWGFGQYLNRHGVALLAPMRRGRGQSQGKYLERYTCVPDRVRGGIDYAAASLDAAFDWLGEQPWAVMDKVMLAGFSRGGILSVVYAARHPDRVAGVVNFSGGWVGDGCKRAAKTDLNAVLFGEAGSMSEVPNLFLYGANDNYYSDASVEGFAEAFRSAGGVLQFELIPLALGVNGHDLFYDYWMVWMPYTDEFLGRLEMTTE